MKFAIQREKGRNWFLEINYFHASTADTYPSPTVGDQGL